MNNKLIKRIAAVVLSVVVLSTCAFATTLSGQGYADETLTFSYTSSADKVSYIAYAATVEAGNYVLGNIVAVNQYDNAPNGEVSVGIDADLLGDATHIVIKSGDSTGADVATVAVLTVAEYETLMSATSTGTHTVTLDGVEYTDVPTFKIAFKNNVEGTATVSSLVAKAPGKADHTIPSEKIGNISYSGQGTFTIENIYLVGAPADYIAAGITLEPVINFVKAQ